MKKKDKDNVIYLDGSEEARENNKRLLLQRHKTKLAIGALVVILLAVVGFFVLRLLNREYKGYRIEKSTPTSYENTANYIEFSGNLLKYTPDGVSYINSNGDVVWSAGIDMNMPIAVTSGSYAVVADIKGNSVCVFSSDDGQIGSYTMPYAICDVDVANQGAFAVVLESDKTNYINLYNKKGEIVYEMQTTIDKSGYPLDITISDNAQKLITSYINVDGTGVTNKIAAYNFGDVGQNSNADRMVGGYNFEDQVFPKVEFVTNNKAVAFGTNSIILYSMKEKPGELARIELEKEIRSVFYSDKYFGYIVSADEGADSEHLYELKLYDLKGKEQFSRYIDFEYDNVYAASKELIITGGDDCMIVRSNGHIKYNSKLQGNIISVVPSGNRLEYVVVYQNSTDIIKLKAEPQNNAPTSDVTTDDDINTTPNHGVAGDTNDVGTDSDAQ